VSVVLADEFASVLVSEVKRDYVRRQLQHVQRVPAEVVARRRVKVHVSKASRTADAVPVMLMRRRAIVRAAHSYRAAGVSTVRPYLAWRARLRVSPRPRQDSTINTPEGRVIYSAWPGHPSHSPKATPGVVMLSPQRPPARERPGLTPLGRLHAHTR
jgi:hypothetical protein